MMIKRVLVSALFFLVHIQDVFTQEFKLIQYATKAPGHKQCEDHPFITSLREATFSQNQLAQFLVDRLYILKFLEKAILNTEDSILFYRSHSYANELVKLSQVNPENLLKSPSISTAAQNYCKYLGSIGDKQKAIHLWLILLGETFGAQHMAKYFQKKFPMMGFSLKDYSPFPSLIQVRKNYMNWIHEQLSQTNLTQEEINEQIDSGYQFQLQAFDAAIQSVDRPSYFYSWFKFIFNY